MSLRIIVCTLLTFLLFSCQKEFEYVVDPVPVVHDNFLEQEEKRLATIVTTQTTRTFLNGKVVNEDGVPLVNATVHCGGQTVLTDSKGLFFFNEPLNLNRDHAVIRVVMNDYLDGYRTFTPNQSGNAIHSEQIVLLSRPAAVSVTFNDSIVADRIKLKFTPNSLLRQDSSIYTGNIKITARYLDPAAGPFPQMMSGRLTGLNLTGQLVALQSFGMASVELKDETGQPLRIADGKTVTIEFPATASGPATIPLWHFNENYGIWVEHGKAEKRGNVYIGEVNHFSTWNLDAPISSNKLNLIFQNSAGKSTANIRFDVYQSNNALVGTFYTDNEGRATVFNCPINQALKLKLIFACDTITKDLAPLTQDREETVALVSGNLQIYNLTGVLKKCDNLVLPNQSFHLFLTGTSNYILVNAMTDAQGHFDVSTVLPQCEATSLQLQTSSFFDGQYYLTKAVTINAGATSYMPELCNATSNNQPFDDTAIVDIPDNNLRQVVRTRINKPTGNIVYADVKDLRYLEANGRGIKSIIGLQYFTGLDSLDIIGNQIVDLAPIQTLTNLKLLNAAVNEIINVSPLENLVNIVFLELQNNRIADISALGKLTLLTHFNVNYNLVSDISVVANMKALQTLNLGSNMGFANLSPLSDLVNIYELNIDFNTDVTNFESIKKLTKLRTLSMNTTTLMDSLSGLKNFPELINLSLQSGMISDLTGLQPLTKLQTLDLRNNVIYSLDPINTYLPALKQFYLYQGNIISPGNLNIFEVNHPSCIIQ